LSNSHQKIKELLTSGDTPAAAEGVPGAAADREEASPRSRRRIWPPSSCWPVRATTDINLFERSVDLFIARKAELVKALQNQQQQSAADKDSLQAALDERLKSR